MTRALCVFGRRVTLVAVLAGLAGWPDCAGAQSPFQPRGPGYPIPRRPSPPAASSGLRSDTPFVPLPPAYPAPAGTFVPLPAGGPPPPPPPPNERDHIDPHGRDPAWVPGRSEVVTGIDDAGRIGHALRDVPGRFDPSRFDR